MSQEEYLDRLRGELDHAWEVANEARKYGEDPEDKVEIKLSDDMAERTEMFLEVDGLAERIRELDEEGYDREEMAFELTDDFLEDKLGDFEEKDDKIEAAIRTAIAILTESVVAAPLEGIQWVKTEKDNKGREYIRIKYDGPIRSAGGTAQVISVLIADYCRQYYDFDKFVPTDDEVERYIEERDLYDRYQSLQYKPGDDEVRTIVRNTPVMLDAAGVTEDEVSGYRDLERIDTNAARGGMCLVAFEGIAQKVPKLQKYTDQLGLEEWDWLTELPNASKVDDSSDEKKDEDNNREDEEKEKPMKHGRVKVKPKSKYIDDTLTAGRPIYGHPSKPGAFRLRYGRSRNIGLAAGGISPATMVIFKEYIAPGTQLKTERPGKAIAAAPVDSLEGPTVKLEDGTILRVDDEEKAYEVMDKVEKVIDVGEIAVPYGEFLENNSMLYPSSYVHEWWVQEAEEAGLDVGGMKPEDLNAMQALKMSEKYDIPLHPKYTYLWHDISFDEYEDLCDALSNGEKRNDGRFEISDDVIEIIENLLVPSKHHRGDEIVILGDEEYKILERCCEKSAIPGSEHIMEAVSEAAGITVRERAPTRIGARMGRPEKAERRTFRRDLNIHGLFPVGSGVNRKIVDASNKSNAESQQLGDNGNKKRRDPDELKAGGGESVIDLASRYCRKCEIETSRVLCPECGERTETHAQCSNCNNEFYMEQEDMGVAECPECGSEVYGYKKQILDISGRLDEALEKLGERKGKYEDMKGVEGLVSQEKVPEPLEKAILRAKYDIGVYKDGTSRYDTTDLPLTAFKPDEIGVSVERLNEIGYTQDMDGAPLTEGDQLVELKPQDIVVPQDAGDYLLRISKFIDDLLEDYYGVEPFYNADEKEDLVGELLIGMAPHTSAGALGRIIGFTDAWGQYAHPLFHAAKRRNCFHPEETLYYEVENNKGEKVWKHGTIEDLVENHIDEENLKTDDFGSEYSTPTRTIRVPSINDDGEQVLKELETVQRTPATDHMVEFETETGQQITVTPDHGMLVYENGEQKKKPAREVKEGDNFIEPSHIKTVGEVNEGESPVVTPVNPEGELGGVQVVSKEIRRSDVETVYNLEVSETHRLYISGILSFQCDSDEDAFMLLLDGLLNYSEHYLNHNKTGKFMDEPVVMNRVVDPTEVDDEAHNVDVVDHYPKELYEASLEGKGPKEVDIEIIEDNLENPSGFKHSLKTESIHGGPEVTMYKELPDMQSKIDYQFEIAEKARAVLEEDVAEKVVDGHFLADLKGNLRAFGTQEVRCTSCNTKYSRPPLGGTCRNCGKDALILTVFEGSVTKYLQEMKRISEKYDVSTYIQEVIDEYDRATDSIFENDKDKQAGLGDFM